MKCDFCDEESKTLTEVINSMEIIRHICQNCVKRLDRQNTACKNVWMFLFVVGLSIFVFSSVWHGEFFVAIITFFPSVFLLYHFHGMSGNDFAQTFSAID